MPAGYTHYCFGKDVYKHLDDQNIKDLLLRNENCFLIINSLDLGHILLSLLDLAINHCLLPEIRFIFRRQILTIKRNIQQSVLQPV